MDRHNDWINLAYLLLVTGVVMWFCITHTKNFHLWQQEKEKMQIEMENLRKENVALIEENQRLKDQVDLHNSVNFSLLNSLVD